MIGAGRSTGSAPSTRSRIVREVPNPSTNEPAGVDDWVIYPSATWTEINRDGAPTEAVVLAASTAVADGTRRAG